MIKRVSPQYPAEAKQGGIQGRVIFSAIISKEGSPRDLELLEGAFALYEESYKAVQQWRWRPTLINSVAKDVQTELVVNYTLGTR